MQARSKKFADTMNRSKRKATQKLKALIIAAHPVQGY